MAVVSGRKSAPAAIAASTSAASKVDRSMTTPLGKSTTAHCRAACTTNACTGAACAAASTWFSPRPLNASRARPFRQPPQTFGARKGFALDQQDADAAPRYSCAATVPAGPAPIMIASQVTSAAARAVMVGSTLIASSTTATTVAANGARSRPRPGRRGWPAN